MRMLEVVGLTKRFAGLIALDAVSFTAEEGQILGMVGPNGAGKTTCCRCVAGFAVPDSGRVIFDGREITGQPAHRLARAGLVRTFQTAKAFTGMTAADNVAVALGQRRRRWPGAALWTWRRPDMRRRALALLERVGLESHADRPAALLTLGMLRRLELARALALEPKVLLLDEPLAGLSHEDVLALSELIRGLRAEGLTVVLVEHRVQTALALADRVVVLDHGALVASGPPERVRRDPRVMGAYRGERAPAAQDASPAR
jgi:branched-chain amino acid transport system ATP-binding protein